MRSIIQTNDQEWEKEGSLEIDGKKWVFLELIRKKFHI